MISRSGAGMMFSSEDRDRLRAELLDRASQDNRLSGAAITGSAAAAREDRWSDIDLAFGVQEVSAVPAVLAEWTAHMYDRHLALHHFDVKSGNWIYRVFLLPSTLQVDLAFVAAAEFRALAPTFHLVFGNARESLQAPGPQPADLIGYGWLYALHARSSIARGKHWQAEYFISAIRDTALALACVRHNVPATHGRGMDLLPRAVTSQFESSLVRQLDTVELSRTFRIVLHALLDEIRYGDEELAGRLTNVFTALTEGDSQRFDAPS